MTDPVVYNGDTNNFTGVGTPNPKLVIPQKNTFDPPTLAMALAIEQWANNLVNPCNCPEPPPIETGIAYVLGQTDASITPIDLATGTPDANFLLGYHNGEGMVSDGTTAWVAVSTPGNVVLPVTIATNSIGTPISPPSPAIGFNGPPLAIDAALTTVYVVESGSPGDMVPITLPSTVGSSVALPQDSRTIALTPDGLYAYIGNFSASTITPITLPSTVGTDINLTTGVAEAIAITPDSSAGYAVKSFQNVVVPFSIPANVLGSPIAIGNNPVAMTISPDGLTGYVCCFNDNTVVPVTLATNAVGTPIPVGNGPQCIAISADGAYAYVGNYSDQSVSRITLSTGAVGTPIAVGTSPLAIVLPL